MKNYVIININNQIIAICTLTSDQVSGMLTVLQPHVIVDKQKPSLNYWRIFV